MFDPKTNSWSVRRRNFSVNLRVDREDVLRDVAVMDVVVVVAAAAAAVMMVDGCGCGCFTCS
jgi:hypothetical protein